MKNEEDIEFRIKFLEADKKSGFNYSFERKALEARIKVLRWVLDTRV